MTERVEAANALAIERMLAADPVLVDVRPAGEVIDGLEDRMILHAGPPIEWARMCGPMRGAVAGAIVLEGWAPTLEAATTLAASGGVRFAPNHHFDAVGPMTGLTTRTMPVMVVENRAFGNRAYCTVNEGLGKVMRFGGNDEAVLDRLRWLASTLAPLLGDALRAGDGIALKALVARGLSMGDEMHQRNVACTSLLLRALAPALARATRDNALLGEVLEFIGGNDQFFLNVAMAMGKAIMDPVRGIAGASIVTAMSRNGTDFGVRLASAGERWFTAPVEMPRGLYFPGFTADDANPDMGDSTIVETVGLGGFAMAASPAGGGLRGGGERERGVGGDPGDVRDHRGAEPGVDDPRAGFRRDADGDRRAQGGRERARADHQHRHRPSGAGGRAGGGRDRERAARLLRAGRRGARRGDGRGVSAAGAGSTTGASNRALNGRLRHCAPALHEPERVRTGVIVPVEPVGPATRLFSSWTNTLTSASAPDPTINSSETALSTGVDPTFNIRSYIVTVSGASEPTRNRVVLKFSKETRNATSPAPIRAGLMYGRVMVRNTRVRLAPRLNAASSSVRSNFLSRAAITAT